jgi:hypothetical protein
MKSIYSVTATDAFGIAASLFENIGDKFDILIIHFVDMLKFHARALEYILQNT